MLEPVGRTAVEHAAALLARGRPDVDDPVGMADHVEIVLDDEQRIAGRLQAVERAQQRLGVGRMQPGGRLVEHVDDAEQVGADLRGQPQPLQLARREGRRAAFQRQIAEPEVEQDGEPPAEVLGDPLGDQRLLGMFGRQLRPCRRPCRRRRGARCRRAGSAAAREISAMSRPANVTDSDSRRSRLPWQSGHSLLIMYCSARFFISGLCVLAKVCSTWRRALVNVPW